jgi:Fe-S-cluster-containing dehydrogenase component
MSAGRRGFLKSLAAGTAAAACGAAATAQARARRTMPPEAVGLLYDGTLCIGCRACLSACKAANGMPIETTGMNGEPMWDSPLDISGKTLNVIKVYRDGTGETRNAERNGHAFTQVSCMHCTDASCVSACPVSAMTKDPATGIVSYNKDACIGCRYCVAACPFGVPRFTYDSPFPQISKCQLCKHRMAEGKYAACAEVCPTGATLYGPVAELKKEIARRKALAPGSETVFPRGRIGGGDSYTGTVAKYVEHVYGEKEIGGTQVLHLSAVPFDKLNKPELPEEAPAAASETLQGTLFHGMIAPVAFLAGLVYVAKRNVKDDPEGGAVSDSAPGQR